MPLTQEEKYWNFVKNYNDALSVQNTNWLDPETMGKVLTQSAEQNEPDCISKIIADIQSGKIV